MADGTGQSADVGRLAGEPGDLASGGWTLVAQHKNPWGRVPVTARGQALEGGTRAYMDRLLATQRQADPVSRRHHYVPRTYLKHWGIGAQSRRIWNLDTITGQVRSLSLSDVCVEENFYRVLGPDGEAHNRVEAMFGVVDTELGRVQALFARLEDPDHLEFDDLMGLGVSIAVQRMRTAQQRRLRLQHDAWFVAQDAKQFKSMSDPSQPLRIAGIHTEMLFKGMWESADMMTTRSIEIWDDSEGRFWTCDAPVLVPFRKNIGPGLVSAPYVLWPVSPHRVVALTNVPSGEKAVIRTATAKERGLVRDAIEQGRERWIFASPSQKDQLPAGKKFRRRTQIRLRCSQRSPSGAYIRAPGCCVEYLETFAAGPDVALCDQGLHAAAPSMWDHA